MDLLVDSYNDAASSEMINEDILKLRRIWLCVAQGLNALEDSKSVRHLGLMPFPL